MNIEDTPADTVNNHIRNLEVRFKEAGSTFYAGGVICGNVDVQTIEDIAVRGIRAQFRGESYVYWQDRTDDAKRGEGSGNRGEGSGVEVVKDHYTIWNQLFTIWGNKVHDDAGDVTLERGEHSFPFAVKIPSEEIPSSFEHRNGAIRYWVKVYIDTNDYISNRYKPFSVLQKIDVGEKRFLSKICNDAEKTMCCSCFGSRSLSLSASIDRTGYCPGESIVVNCRGKNQARRDIGGIKARLIQNIIYTVGKHLKREENIISAIGGNRIEKGRTKVWENQLLKIPPVPPTINNFGIVSVLYNVQITMVVPNGVDLQFYLPITIGTKPRGVNNLNYRANVRFKRCTDGIECFNHSSKSYNFPLLAYVPYTAVMENYVFVPQRNLTSNEYTVHRSFSRMEDDEENQYLIRSETQDTLVT